jgi:hypothetical protein
MIKKSYWNTGKDEKAHGTGFISRSAFPMLAEALLPPIATETSLWTS